MRTFHSLLCVALLIIASACVNKKINGSSVESESSEKSIIERFKTKSIGLNDLDSLKLKSRMQSDFDNLIMNRIVFRDSMYVLSLSKESASIIGIPESLYNRYVDYIRELNNQL